jgi:hypothetical protein
MPIIEDAAPRLSPQDTSIPPGTPFTVRIQIHTTGKAIDARVRYGLDEANDFVFSATGEKTVVNPVRIQPTSTAITKSLTLTATSGNSNGGGDVFISVDVLKRDSDDVLFPSGVVVPL